MKIFSGFTMVVYTIIFLIIGAGLICVSLQVVPFEEIVRGLDYVYYDLNAKTYVGVAGLLVIFYSLFTLQISIGNFRREKTIAFDNPGGQVTISLTAIEDFIRKTAAHIPEVKELKPNVVAGKKGINIGTRAVVFSDSNIPDATEKVQAILKSRIQEMLGIEEAITIKVHIAKIVERTGAGKKGVPEKQPPYRGAEFSNV